MCAPVPVLPGAGVHERCACGQVIHVDMPTVLNAGERACIEFEELGRNLNAGSGPLRRAAVPALAITRGTMGTGDSIRRVAQDVTSLTQARPPDLAHPPYPLQGSHVCSPSPIECT